MLIRGLLVLFCIFLAHEGKSQFWFGIKAGPNLSTVSYTADSTNRNFDRDGGLRYQVGLTMNYEATKKYSVQTELLFERFTRTISNTSRDAFSESVQDFGYIKSTGKYSLISVPLLFRIAIDRSRWSFYVNGGPKISYWISGTTQLYADELIEVGFENGEIERKISFKDYGTDGEKHYLFDKNRVQYSLDLGVGVNFDMRVGRTFVDFRYSYGHSNMGYNPRREQDFDSYLLTSRYIEDMEFRHHLLTVTAGYCIEYKYLERLKGKSEADNK